MSGVKLENVDRLRMLLFMAWRNLWRNRLRTGLTVSALTVGLILMIVYSALIEGMAEQMIRFATDVSIGHMQIHREEYSRNKDLYALLPEETPGNLSAQFKDIAVAPRLYAAGLASSGDFSTGILIKAINPVLEKKVSKLQDYIRTGSPDYSFIDGSSRLYKVTIGTQLSRNLKVNIGDELVIVTQAIDGSIGNALFLISGIHKPIDSGFDRSGVIMSVTAYRDLMYLDQGYHEIAVRNTRPDQLEQTRNRLHEFINDASITETPGGPVLVQTWRELVPAVSDLLNINRSVIYIVGAIMIGLASLGMMNTMLMAIHERIHELGILLALGMGHYWILVMVMLEAILLTFISAIMGSVLGVLSSVYLEAKGIDLSGYLPEGIDLGGIIWEPIWYGKLTVESVYVGIAVTFVVATIASLIPCWRTIRLQPSRVLHG